MRTSYTYTVLRYVHDITTGEFANVGVVLYAPSASFAGVRCRHTLGRISKTFPGMDGDAFKSLMRHVESRLAAMSDRIRNDLPNVERRPETAMDLAHSVLPADDSSLQWSPMGSGITEAPATTLDSLCERFVTRYDESGKHERRSDEEVWREYRRALENRHVASRLQPKKIAVQDDEVEFRYAWQNGIWHCLEPVSFDLTSADSIREKAHRWLGQLLSVREAPEQFKVYLLLGEPKHDAVRPAFEKALSMLWRIPVQSEVVRECDATAFSERFAREIATHEVQGN